MRRFSKISKIVLILLAIILMISCEKKVSRVPQTGEAGGEVVVGIVGEPENLSPIYPSFIAHNEIVEMLFLPLHKNDVNGKIVPMLATSWEYSEDLKKITYYLRKDVVWQDGEPVTAYDVEFTFNLIKDPKNNSPLFSKLQNIDSVKAVSDYKIVFYCNKVYPMALFDSNIKPLPKHLLEKEKDQLQYSDFNSKPVGNGPYKLEKWESGKYISLVKNENYSLDDKPFLDKIVYRIYTDQQSIINDLKEGKLDLVYDLTPDNAEEIAKIKNVTGIQKKGNIYTYIGFNLTRKPFDLKDFRMGISQLINRDLLIKNTIKNGIPSNGPITPSFWAYSEEIKPISYSKDGIKLLEKVLKKDNIKGYLYNNKPFILNIITDKNDAMLVKVAREVSNQLKNAGINVNLKELPSDSLILKLFSKDYDLYILSWQINEDFNPLPFWSSVKETGRFNFVEYRNPKVDSIVNLAMTTMDEEEARNYWKEFQQIVVDDQPYAFLFVPNRVIVANNVLKSFDNVYSSNIEPISNLDIFYVEKPNQKKIDFALLFPAPKVEEKIQESETKVNETNKNLKKEVKEEVKPKEETQVKTPTASQLLSQQVQQQAQQQSQPVVDTVKKEEEKKPQVIIQPTPKQIIQPAYPEAARKIGAEGTVFVEVTIGKDGKVVAARVIKSLNPACDNAAVEAAYKAVFNPGTIDGVPAEMKTTIPYRFKP